MFVLSIQIKLEGIQRILCTLLLASFFHSVIYFVYVSDESELKALLLLKKAKVLKPDTGC